MARLRKRSPFGGWVEINTDFMDFQDGNSGFVLEERPGTLSTRITFTERNGERIYRVEGEEFKDRGKAVKAAKMGRVSWEE